MIDLTKLTRQELLGLQFARQTANTPIIDANSIEGAVQINLFTDQSYAEFILRSACGSYHSNLVQVKKQSVLTVIDALTPEQQDALAIQLQVPDIIKS